jgi:hypothetical protein
MMHNCMFMFVIKLQASRIPQSRFGAGEIETWLKKSPNKR